MTSCTQLTQEQRYQIHAFKKVGCTQRAIARELQVHPSTISRELKRNTGQRGYRPKQAQEMAKTRVRERIRRTRIAVPTWETIESRLKEQWSPEQIADWLLKT